MDILISTSLGLCKDATGHYYGQIISDKEDAGGERHDIFFPLTPKEAKRLSKKLGLSIEDWDSTISLMYHDIISN